MLATLSSSTARLGSLCSRATAACIVGSQYLWTIVSSGECLVEFGRQLLRACGVACPRQCQGRHRPYVAIRGQLQGRIGVSTGLRWVARFHLAQRRCYLISGGSLFRVVVLG